MKNKKVRLVLRYVLWAFLVFILLLLETGIPPEWRLFGLMPDIGFVLTAVIGWKKGYRWGGFLGALIGFAHDLLGAEQWIAGPILCMLFGFVLGWFAENRNRNGIDYLLITGVGSVLCSFVRSMGKAVLISNTSFFADMLYLELPTYGVTFLVAVLIWVVAFRNGKKRINYQFEEKEKPL